MTVVVAKVPRQAVEVGQLPRNAGGKVVKAQLNPGAGADDQWSGR